MSKEVVLRAEEIHKSFKQNNENVAVLLGVDFSVTAGEQVAIVGPSGSGKNGLLHILAGLDSADHGSVLCAGEDMGAAHADERARIRREKWALYISDTISWQSFQQLKMLRCHNVCAASAIKMLGKLLQHYLSRWVWGIA